jgi:hypothetical protein
MAHVKITDSEISPRNAKPSIQFTGAFPILDGPLMPFLVVQQIAQVVEALESFGATCRAFCRISISCNANRVRTERSGRIEIIVFHASPQAAQEWRSGCAENSRQTSAHDSRRFCSRYRGSEKHFCIRWQRSIQKKANALGLVVTLTPTAA